jgi:hypothetical protein
VVQATVGRGVVPHRLVQQDVEGGLPHPADKRLDVPVEDGFRRPICVDRRVPPIDPLVNFCPLEAVRTTG